jgi:hypothetical protein
MSILIACVSNKKHEQQIFMAHKLEEKSNHYKCGVCLIGDIFLSCQKKLMIKKCVKCNANLSLEKNNRIKI